MIKIFVLKEIY